MALLDALARELMLFAGVGLLVGGLDELAVDLCFWWGRLFGRHRRLTLTSLPPAPPTRFAVFVPAWDEAAVIGPMLRTMRERFGTGDYRIYVGVYPNDPATAAAARAVGGDIRIVVGPRPGPTTKADNLNSLWAALRADDRAADAVVIHDAEDLVHPAELQVFAALIADRDVVQLPVLPIVGQGVSVVSAVYGDEFAESHTRSLTVRAAIGAGLPLAGTGCCLRVDRLCRIAAERGGLPFDAGSLVEDYELGLLLTDAGARGCFARVRGEDGRSLVAVRAIFPGTLDGAVRQKARWMAGIALAGWDRTGWSRARAIGDHWMRLRDRRAPLAMVVLATAYAAMPAWGASAAAHWLAGSAPPALSRPMTWLLGVNSVLLGWRMLMRMAFTGRAYGAAEALRSLPRFIIGNMVSLIAAPRALLLYARLLRGDPPAWDKTAHVFPNLAQSAAA